MPLEDEDPVVLPANPQTLAELLPYLPLPFDYCDAFACVFSEELANRLEEVQAENPQQFRASAQALTDGTYMLRGAILSEVPTGLYGSSFALLDAGRFDEIAMVPWADAVALLPVPEPVPV